MLALAERHEVDVVFPQSSAEVGQFAEARSRFPMPVLVSPPAAIAACNDKAATAELAARAGVRSPETVLARTPAEFRAAAERARLSGARRLHEAALRPRARAASACSRRPSTGAGRCSRRGPGRCR